VRERQLPSGGTGDGAPAPGTGDRGRPGEGSVAQAGMLVDIRMPKLGESITEGTIVRWLKAVGDPVAEYEPLLEIETDKVTTEYPSPYGGVVADIVAREGQTIPVGDVIARIRVEGAAPADG